MNKYLIRWKWLNFPCRSHVEWIKVHRETFIHFSPCAFISKITKWIWKWAKFGLRQVLWSLGDKYIWSCFITWGTKTFFLVHAVTIHASILKANCSGKNFPPTLIKKPNYHNDKFSFYVPQFTDRALYVTVFPPPMMLKESYCEKILKCLQLQ